MCARARVGVFHGAFGVRGKYFPHLGYGAPFFIAENISSISKGGQVAARALKKRNGGGLAKFF